MGRLGMATAPRMTITMAMTIANTGRSMKNRAIAAYPPCFPAPRYGMGAYRHAGPHAELPFHDHAVAGLPAPG